VVLQNSAEGEIWRAITRRGEANLAPIRLCVFILMADHTPLLRRDVRRRTAIDNLRGIVPTLFHYDFRRPLSRSMVPPHIITARKSTCIITATSSPRLCVRMALAAGGLSSLRKAKATDTMIMEIPKPIRTQCTPDRSDIGVRMC